MPRLGTLRTTLCVVSLALLIAAGLPANAFSQSLSFTPVTQSGVLPHQFSDAKADLNNDGREDYFYGQSGQLAIELSTGDGTYAAPAYYTDPYGTPSSFASGDFNGDGFIDLVTSESTAGFTLFLNNGDGTFRQAARFLENDQVLGIVAGDFNRDGKLDVVFLENNSANVNTPFLRARFGDGNGYFSTGTTTTMSSYAERLWLGDFDGDGNADVMTEAHTIGTNVIIAYGDGAGNFVQGPIYHPQLMGPADVNGDGRMDFIGSNNFYTTHGTGQTNTLSIFSANADRTFTQSTVTLARCAEQGAPGIAVSDFNGDGRPDIAVVEASDCQGDSPFYVSVLLRNADGTYQPEQDVYSSADLFYMATIPVIRANQDTKPDLAIVPFTSTSVGTFTTLLNTSSGNFPSCTAPVDSYFGINICSPGSSTTTTAVHFGIGAAGQSWMRKVEVWVDGSKLAEQFAHAFSHYAFMDYDATLSSGTHQIDVYAAGWDNQLQHASFATNVGSGTGAGGCAQPTVPGVNICSPKQGSTVTSPFTISAAGRNSGATDGMDVWLDGHKVGWYPGTSVNIQVTAGTGSHQLDIYAVGVNGELKKSTVTFSVGTTSGGGGTGGGSCSQPSSPGVNICSPTSGSTVTSPFTISAAGRNSGTTDGMDVWLDGKKVGFYQGTTVNIQVSAGSGSHQLDIYAVGTNGELQEKTVIFSVGTTTGGGGGGSCSARTSPGVTICTPANGSTVSSPVHIEAYGMNSGPTDGMDVYIDGHHTGWYGSTTHISISVALGSGSHQLDVYAVGTNGELQESTVHFSVP